MNAQILVVPPSLLKEHENDLAHLRSTRLADRPAFDLVQVAHQTASCGRGLNLPGTNEEHSRHLQPRTPSLAMLINHIPVIDSWNTVIYDPDIEIDPLDPVSITTSRAARVGSARFVSIPSNQPSRVPIAGVHLSPISSGTTSNTATLPQVDDTFLFKSLSSYRLNNDPGEAISSNTPSLFISAYDFAPRRSGDQVGPTDRGGSMPKFASQRIRRVSKASISALRKLSRAARGTARRGTLHILYNKAQVRQKELRRSEFIQRVFEYGVYLTLVASVYLILVGQPLWKGLVLELYWLCEQSFIGGAGVFLGLAVFYAYSPLFAFFEPYPENTAFGDLGGDVLSNSRSTALLIPCYKSASIIPGTLEAALKIFPKENIFVIANGNSPTPLDNTEEVCTRYGVNHTWCPIGSKIAAQFVGCYVVKDFPYVLLIDDDCALPPNFPVVSSRLTDMIKCIGYTIKSVGPAAADGSGPTLGTLCQQAQDLEYKISGLQRQMAGLMGSATFPHGAISIWDREFLVKTFHAHPGFSVSEDWFFGHVARQLGSRITMTSSIFVETETPSSVFGFMNKIRGRPGGARGGFGEMTVYSQRFKRWNFFFVTTMYYNMRYILFSWKLGLWEIGAKLFVFQEFYETILYLLTPFILPISFKLNPTYTTILLSVTFAIYFLNALIVNYVHLRRKKESVSLKALAYYMPYKAVLTVVNVASCYWSIWKYASYFAKRHPKVVQDDKVIEVALRLEEEISIPGIQSTTSNIGDLQSRHSSTVGGGRRMTITAVGVRLNDAVAGT